MTNSKYAAFVALDPFFDIVMQGLAGAVDGDHYFEAIADDAVFEYRYVFPGFPSKIEGRDALMALYSRYGDSTVLHSGDALIVHRSQDPRVVIIEYEVHGRKSQPGTHMTTGSFQSSRSKIARSCAAAPDFWTAG